MRTVTEPTIPKITVDDAIHDLTYHINFVGDNQEITTRKDVIDLMRSTSHREHKLKADKRKLAEFIIKNWHACPIPSHVHCSPGFQENGCVDCLLDHIDMLSRPRSD